MLIERLRGLLESGMSRPGPGSPEAGGEPGTALPAAAGSAAAIPVPASEAWPPARLAAAQAIWGNGFLTPWCGEEILNLAAPLGLDATATVLLVAESMGGPAAALAAASGAWVSAAEPHPELVHLAEERCRLQRLGKKVTISRWESFAPARWRAHHAVLIEPLRGAPPDTVLPVLAASLRAGSQLAMVELVADMPLDAADPAVAAWAAREHRPAALPRDAPVTAELEALQFDVPVVEDVTARHGRRVLTAWSALAQHLARRRPDPAQAAALVTEAELWMLRLRLIRTGAIRVVRWHAIRRR